MIDWITAILPCNHDQSKLQAGLVACLDAEGNIQWKIDKALSVPGSHDSSIQIKTYTERSIWVSGNPTKWLQGHNIFGSDDLIHLVATMFAKLWEKEELGLAPTMLQDAEIRAGLYTLSRVDINQSWMLPDRAAVLAWIRAAGSTCRIKHRGAGQYAGDTLYFGKHSRRWAVKCYSKGHELADKGHQLPKDLQHPELLEYADKALRIELVMRGMALKDKGLQQAKAWTPAVAKQLLSELVLSQLEISDNMPAPDDLLKSLRPGLRAVYVLWQSGEDVRQTYSKAQFYKHRRALLAHGIDIAIPQERERNNVVPLIRYLEAEPAEIPQWAYDKGLVA